MDQITDERIEKYDRIVQKYEETPTQREVADMYGMNKRHVAKVTQLDNCHNTRKVTCENVRKGEAMIPIIFAYQLYFFDKYPIENFR